MDSPLVQQSPKSHKDSVTTLVKSSRPRRALRRSCRALEETPAGAPENPLRGKFPRRASQRVVPLGWSHSGTFLVGNPTNKTTASKLFGGESLCPSTVRRCSEYACLRCPSTVLLANYSSFRSVLP